MELEGAVAVVTGAAAGIGRATALALARAGSDIVAADVNDTAEVAHQIEEAGRRALQVTVDVSRREEVERLVTEAIAWQDHCDVFVSNVGVGCFGLPHEFTPDEWESLLNVNLWSAIWPLRLVIPHMLERERGHLVFVTSGAGFEGNAERAPYNVAKFGLVGLAESVARALKDTNVDVSLIVPGAVATQGWSRIVVANAERVGAEAVEKQRLEHQGHTTNWPGPEGMADAIVDGIQQRRYCIVQHNPFEPEWFANVLTKKGRDPDGFVLSGS